MAMLNRFQKDKMYMFLEMDEQFNALKIPMRTRKMEFQLQYTDHFPKLLVRSPRCEPVEIVRMDTRSKTMTHSKPEDPDIAKALADQNERLMALNCVLAMSFDKDKQGRKRIKLQLVSRHAKECRHTLWWITKGETSKWLTHEDFTAPEI